MCSTVPEHGAGGTLAALGNRGEGLTAEFDNTVQFGLMTFPVNGGGVCDPGKLDVPVAAMNASAVNSFIDMTGPGGFTPTADTLKAALAALGERTVVADGVVTPAYVLLVTDGEPDCPSMDNPDPGPGAVNAVTALDEAGIKTYVIGYNLAGGADLMNQMAQAGGTDKYFEVENQQDITDAFHQITDDIVKCEFELSETPQNPDFARVTIDGSTVTLNAADGWMLNGTTITLQMPSATCSRMARTISCRSRSRAHPCSEPGRAPRVRVDRRRRSEGRHRGRRVQLSVTVTRRWTPSAVWRRYVRVFAGVLAMACGVRWRGVTTGRHRRLAHAHAT